MNYHPFYIPEALNFANTHPKDTSALRTISHRPGLPPCQNISADIGALPPAVPSICGLQAGRGTGREELELLRLSSPNNFPHTKTNWARVRAHKDGPQFSKTTPLTKKPGTPPHHLH